MDELVVMASVCIGPLWWIQCISPWIICLLWSMLPRRWEWKKWMASCSFIAHSCSSPARITNGVPLITKWPPIIDMKLWFTAVCGSLNHRRYVFEFKFMKWRNVAAWCLIFTGSRVSLQFRLAAVDWNSWHCYCLFVIISPASYLLRFVEGWNWMLQQWGIFRWEE